MKNWKTTLVGAIAGGLTAIAPLLEGSDVSVSSILSGFAIAVLGYLAKDFGVTGKGK